MRTRIAITGMGIIMVASAVALFTEPAHPVVTLSFWDFTDHGGWAMGFFLSGLSMFGWALWPRMQVFYYGSIILATTAIWARAMAIILAQHRWVGFFSWVAVLWLMLNIWPRWRVMLFLGEAEVDAAIVEATDNGDG